MLEGFEACTDAAADAREVVKKRFPVPTGECMACAPGERESSLLKTYWSESS